MVSGDKAEVSASSGFKAGAGMNQSWFSYPVEPKMMHINSFNFSYEGCPKSFASYFFKNRIMMLERYPAVVI